MGSRKKVFIGVSVRKISVGKLNVLMIVLCLIDGEIQSQYHWISKNIKMKSLISFYL